MKTLYILAHYPQGSESYVEAEISYFLSRGVQIEIWSPQSGYGDKLPVKVHRKTLQEAISGFNPNVIHVHHMTTAEYYIKDLPRKVTVRAHSFDWSEGRATNVLSNPAVRKLYAFPHFAKRLSCLFLKSQELYDKIVPLPVAYDPTLYYQSWKIRRSVLRLTAGLPTKSLDHFIIAGNKVEDAKFVLGINTVIGKESEVVDKMNALNRKLGGRVQIQTNISRKDAADLVRMAGIYMSTSDPTSHPFGMPVSIAEAMATGAYVLARNQGPEVLDYLGGAGSTYTSVEHAESLIRMAIDLSDQGFEEVSTAAVRSAARFRSDVVLERVMKDWEEISLG